MQDDEYRLYAYDVKCVWDADLVTANSMAHHQIY